ncbi:hypothetical protein Tco_0770169 [Tanacetum coccineum]|uniref:Uncharacterized protein n=1 Tax=Tanacetum coccineum TaxID=301880 RepID=A0ABQ4ZFB7_9ASTR
MLTRTSIKLSLAPFFLPQRQAPVGGVAIRERVAKEIQRLPDVEGKGKAIVIEEQAAHSLIDCNEENVYISVYLQRRDQSTHDSTTGPSSQPQDDTSEKVVETCSIIPDLSHQTNTSAPSVTTPVINISSPKPSSQVNTPPINTEATSIITTIPEITPFIALQLRVAKLEQDMSEVKKTDHSAVVLASISIQVPIVVG